MLLMLGYVVIHGYIRNFKGLELRAIELPRIKGTFFGAPIPRMIESWGP